MIFGKKSVAPATAREIGARKEQVIDRNLYPQEEALNSACWAAPLRSALSPLHFHTLYLYTSTPLRLYAYKPIHLYRIHLYTSIPIHLYTYSVYNSIYAYTYELLRCIVDCIDVCTAGWTYNCTASEKARNSNMRHRPIGIGIQATRYSITASSPNERNEAFPLLEILTLFRCGRN